MRAAEQRKAALIGDYACQVQLGFPSAVVKDGSNDEVTVFLRAIFEGAAPEVVYLHNPADRHNTHVGLLSPFFWMRFAGFQTRRVQKGLRLRGVARSRLAVR